MKKKLVPYISQRWRKMSCPLLMVGLLIGSPPLNAQDNLTLNRKVTVKVRNQPISNVLSEIEKQTNLSFVYDGAQIDPAQFISISANDATLKEVLHNIFNETVKYTIVGNQVIVKHTGSNGATSYQVAGRAATPVQDKRQIITGSVTLRDTKGNEQRVPGITIRVKGKIIGTQTNGFGSFRIMVEEGDILVVSFVGYKTREIPFKANSPLEIVLEEDATKVKEVVITGIYERNKESTTGSIATYTAKELKQIGNQNVIQSLRSLDPSFTVFENNKLGANPNILPSLEIRGKTSILGLKEQFGTDPNQPLFILDGFQTTLRTIIDLDMNRVESVTILKDAASTAIYGAKAANGVIVVETRKPKPGELRVSYSTDNSIVMPDLRDYNLMNATEKLEFERITGRYRPNSRIENDENARQLMDSLYNVKKLQVLRGVNTYWMSEPLQVGYATNHSLYIEGGDNQMRYSAGANYKKVKGVMKGSGRDMGGANLKLMYRKKKLSFNNNLSVNFYTANESSWGSFENFARANPYYPKRNEDGTVSKYLDILPTPGGGYDTTANPLFNALQPNMDRTKNFGVVNNFNVEYAVNNDLRIRARVGITKEQEKHEIFLSPKNTRFDAKDPMEKGSYSNVETTGLNYDGELTATYGRVIARKHQLNGVVGWNFQQNQRASEGYDASGFPDKVNSPAYAAGYAREKRPYSAEATTRSTGFYMNGGYMYDQRFVVEGNYRLDGSSVFGSRNFFRSSWSAGVSWNLHNETFMQPYSFVNMLKLRAAIGTPGNQNFSAYQSYTTYYYHTNAINNFGVGASIDNFGNPSLLWQQTLDKNLGADIVVLNNRLKINADVYQRTTDPLIAVISVPSSVGTTSYTTNLGAQQGTGYNFQATVFPIYRPEQRTTWSFSFSAKHEKAHFTNIGNKLDQMNKAERSKSLTRYYDGGSPTAIWAVRSAGIDPGTGNEVFIKKDGSLTFSYDADDEVVVGDERPKLDGIIGTNFFYKGLTVGVYLRYRVGGDIFNDALYNKVENINTTDIRYNQDRRALYDRWQQPGDRALYRRISMTTITNQIEANMAKRSTRFVEQENTLAGESINVGYEVPHAIVKRWHLSYLRLNAYMNDIFRISTIKRERGIDYPFANMMSFSISLGF
ncbi:SusC/RagA family TonB-linked outer membrane protein [Chitinophaga nivalis]|uniref:SusC/RagA family TonB-linked outer membrane protein n=1 Tax=Chitinophaga nivalis TaxID=2991709 RepID=A0ABT3ITP0_9BACT|nr:SusC/RagA family TonB-linked outer membrane protein [Chitinophaga nivalis]MCW3462948.1 SusC/RagA family TonB-linked outer membrane protein [Chitinophaga nivalis]MCW3487362.1 SusC/RagA family TonB-linked outer membrane protein [Chitinophaga nivalis]